jgi:hypothetical protein
MGINGLEWDVPDTEPNPAALVVAGSGHSLAMAAPCFLKQRGGELWVAIGAIGITNRLQHLWYQLECAYFVPALRLWWPLLLPLARAASAAAISSAL